MKWIWWNGILNYVDPTRDVRITSSFHPSSLQVNRSNSDQTVGRTSNTKPYKKKIKSDLNLSLNWSNSLIEFDHNTLQESNSTIDYKQTTFKQFRFDQIVKFSKKLKNYHK